MTRSKIHGEFAKRFGDGTALDAITSEQVDSLEARLGIVMPEAYVAFLIGFGAVKTPSLLDYLEGAAEEPSDITEFLDVAKVVEITATYVEGGMPDDLVPFASDCMGNMFCFRRVATGQGRPSDAAIWFFDHDFCDVSKEAESFDQFLLRYLKLEFSEEASNEPRVAGTKADAFIEPLEAETREPDPNQMDFGF